MPGEQDRETGDFLVENEHDLSIGGPDVPHGEAYQLGDIVRGRMLCMHHGRICYRRVSFTGEREWVCPDERHGKPIRDS